MSRRDLAGYLVTLVGVLFLSTAAWSAGDARLATEGVASALTSGGCVAASSGCLVGGWRLLREPRG